MAAINYEILRRNMLKHRALRKGGRGRRLLCGGFASTNRRMTMNKNIAIEGGDR